MTHVLTADIGGTHTRLALIDDQSIRSASLGADLRFKKYRNREHPSLLAIIEKFRSDVDIGFSSVAVAVAGLIIDDRVVSANVPWNVDGRELKRSLEVDGVAVVNDLEAMAYGVCMARDCSGHHLIAPNAFNRHERIAVFGLGTGFGAALCVPAEGGVMVLGTEIGQARFRVEPAQALESGLNGRLDAVFSGLGLTRLHAALTAGALIPSEQIIDRARHSSGIQERKTILQFIGMLLKYIADVIPTLGAFGGVALGGGLSTALVPFFAGRSNLEGLAAEGPLRDRIGATPLAFCLDERLALLGAACSI